MSEGDDNHRAGRRAGSSERGSRNMRGPLTAVAAIVALAVVAGTVASCGDHGPSFWRQGGGANANACPRPASLTGSEFNAQEAGLRALRRAAFRGDFFAQLELGQRYAAVRATDKNIEDPIESSVWTGMALANDQGYSPINRAERGGMFGGLRSLSRYDDCRAWERHEAYNRLDGQLSRMSRDEQEEVRDRMIYVLSTQDAEGFRTLARLHDSLFGPFGEPEDNPEGARPMAARTAPAATSNGAAPAIRR
jgi:hypothetical protein